MGGATNCWRDQHSGKRETMSSHPIQWGWGHLQAVVGGGSMPQLNERSHMVCGSGGGAAREDMDIIFHGGTAAEASGSSGTHAVGM